MIGVREVEFSAELIRHDNAEHSGVFGCGGAVRRARSECDRHPQLVRLVEQSNDSGPQVLSGQKLIAMSTPGLLRLLHRKTGAHRVEQPIDRVDQQGVIVGPSEGLVPLVERNRIDAVLGEGAMPRLLERRLGVEDQAIEVKNDRIEHRHRMAALLADAAPGFFCSAGDPSSTRL
jgi:hypothetical protein